MDIEAGLDVREVNNVWGPVQMEEHLVKKQDCIIEIWALKAKCFVVHIPAHPNAQFSQL